MKTQSGGRRWVAGALRAARAAAFLTLATGINGTIAALEPRYEPIYVYLAAIVVVAWLGGILLGVTTAVAAVVLYDWMFAPAHAGPSWNSVVPFVIAIGAAVVTRLARAPFERPRLAPTPPRPLLEASPEIVATTAPPVDTSQVDDLRMQLEGLQHELDAARNDAREQATRHDEERDAEAEATRRQLRSSSARVDELTKRLDETTQELEVAWRRVDEEKRRSDAEASRLAELERQANEALQRAVADLAARYQEPLAEAKKSLAEAFIRIPIIEKERDEAREAARVADARQSALQEEVDRVRALLDAETSRAGHESSLRAQIDGLRREAEDARTRAELEQSHRERLEAAADRKIASIAAGLTSDYESALGEATVEREAARAEVRDLTSKLTSLERRLSDERQAVLAAREESAKLRDETVAESAARLIQSEAQVAALTNQIDGLESELADVRRRADAERAEHENAAAGFDAKIASIAAGLTLDYESALGEATVEREAARAEVRDLTSKLTSLERQLADERQAALATREESARLRGDTTRLESELADVRGRADAERAEHEKAVAGFDAKIASIAAALTSDYEMELGEATVDREAARAEVRTLTNRLTSLRAELDAEKKRAEMDRAEHETVVAGFDAKIASIAAGLTADYESALGEATVDREAARAEVRDLTGKVKMLRAEVEAARRHAEAERAEYEKAVAGFDTKIATIVANITSDNENAIAEAMVEREGARAEVRSLTQKLDAVQRKLSDFQAQVEKTTSELRRSVDAERQRADQERAAREKSEAEWSDKLQRIVTNIAGDHESDLGDALVEREAARAEARQLGGRLKTLQQTLNQERARSASSDRPTVAGNARRPAVILVVHSDAGMRAMSKHTLEQTGYTVLTAADGLEGLRTASAQRPDVVLTEAVMPKMNGRELVQLLKAKSDTAGIKIVLMGSQSGADAATDFRADDVLPSPSDFVAMRATLANVLEK